MATEQQPDRRRRARTATCSTPRRPGPRRSAAARCAASGYVVGRAAEPDRRSPLLIRHLGSVEYGRYVVRDHDRHDRAGRDRHRARADRRARVFDASGGPSANRADAQPARRAHRPHERRCAARRPCSRWSPATGTHVVLGTFLAGVAMVLTVDPGDLRRSPRRAAAPRLGHARSNCSARCSRSRDRGARARGQRGCCRFSRPSLPVALIVLGRHRSRDSRQMSGCVRRSTARSG